MGGAVTINKLYYVDVKVFDIFEETSSIVRKVAIAADEDSAKDIVAKQIEKEIKSAEIPCAGYEIIDAKLLGELKLCL